MSIVGAACRHPGATVFDNAWFGLTDRQAADLDTRQRTSLELAVQALDDSGLGCLARGSHAAVVFAASGAGAANPAQHLSRALDLHGPSLLVDSGRTSPLTAVDTAVRLLADRSIPFALAGGADLTLPPDISGIELAAVDGTCTILILQRTSDIARTRTRAYAEIDGQGLGFGTPAHLHIPLRATSDRRAADPHPGNRAHPDNSAEWAGQNSPRNRESAEQNGTDPSRNGARGACATDRSGRAGGVGPPGDRGDEPPVLIPISGRDAGAVRELAADWAGRLHEFRNLREFAAAVGRLVPEAARATVLARDRADAARQLRALSADEVVTANGGGRVLFLFSGGGEHPRMGRALAARYPVFAAALTTAADAIAEAGGPRVWTPRNGFGPLDGGADFTQPALFAFQVALAELLGSWGIRPDGIAGHGVGEIAGAVVSGALSPADGARIVVARGVMLTRVRERGAAAVLEATPAEAMRLVEPMRSAVGVAAIDGPRSVTVSGEPRYIDALVRRAHRRAIFAQRVADAAPGTTATMPHLPTIRALAPTLIEELQGISPDTPDIPVYSTTHRSMVLAPARNGDSPMSPPTNGHRPTVFDAAYWGANAAGPVELSAALELAAVEGISTVLEIAPHPVLTRMVREHIGFRETTCAASSRTDEAATFLRAVGRLYLAGRDIDWTALGPLTAAPPPRRWRRDLPLPKFPKVSIRAECTYVVAGDLGSRAALAVRWLIDAGAQDIVVLTRTLRPLPPPLDGMEDRIVLVRCDIADALDLAEALQDIRDCGSDIRGVVYADDEPSPGTSAALVELTSVDALDFAVVEP
ncbi:acyltransferase domain-containing protein [Nocardia sp. 2]|uniref:Acyltransferase domain-containing protein n=1 Tax=Nocardia acididurans TaxID=2802282 RepID=A0ABS1LXP7_9NOCA|nr:acyltransferase domain-containing protein [Nocardia acididurans]MBL1073143.1 acyltransferase domain-containing protein [Nocardia acididurans]